MVRPTAVSRRALLTSATAASVALASTGCSTGTQAGPRGETATTRPVAPGDASSSAPAPVADPDVDLVKAAIADERAILAYCARGHRRGAPAAVRLVAAQQRDHVGALRAALTDAGQDRIGQVPPRPATDAALRTTTRSLLLQAQRRRRSDALSAESGLLARLFASLSASHAVLAGLDELSR